MMPTLTINPGTNTTTANITSVVNGDLFEMWRDYTDVTGQTLKTYTKGLKLFKDWIISNDILAPTYQDIRAYKQHLIDTGKATSTINLYLSAIKNFFAFLDDYDIYPDVAFKVKGIKDKCDMYKRDALSKEEINELLNSIDTTTVQGKRDIAMISLMCVCGLRTIEISRADIKDITRKNCKEILLIQGKGRNSKNEYVEIPVKVKRFIQRYLDARTDDYTPESPLFISCSNRKDNDNRLTTDSISRTVRGYLKEIGIYRPFVVTAHSLRHTAAMIGLLNGQSLTDIQVMLRHTSSDTTRIYTHSIERLKNNSENVIADCLLSDIQ